MCGCIVSYFLELSFPQLLLLLLASNGEVLSQLCVRAVVVLLLFVLPCLDSLVASFLFSSVRSAPIYHVTV